jgi:hypothetical protein
MNNLAIAASLATVLASSVTAFGNDDQELRAVLQQQGFTGKVESTLTTRLGRSILSWRIWGGSCGLTFREVFIAITRVVAVILPPTAWAIRSPSRLEFRTTECRAQSYRSTEPASDAKCREYGVLSELDVEWTFLGAIRKPVRQFAGFSVPTS